MGVAEVGFSRVAVGFADTQEKVNGRPFGSVEPRASRGTFAAFVCIFAGPTFATGGFGVGVAGFTFTVT
jgi:hypothetical protein